MTSQIPLRFSFDRNFQFSNFYVPANERVHATLKQLASADKPAGFYVLAGDMGLGKSHLAQAVCGQAQASGISAIYLCMKELVEHIDVFLDTTSEWVDSISNYSLICVDNIDTALTLEGEQREALEEQIFRLLNRNLLQREQGLILTASQTLHESPFMLQDLRSRLNLAELLRLSAHSDTQLLELIRFKAKRIGLEMPEEVAIFLFARMPRDLHSISNMIQELDQYSLATTRRLTVPMVKLALNL